MFSKLDQLGAKIADGLRQGAMNRIQRGTIRLAQRGIKNGVDDSNTDARGRIGLRCQIRQLHWQQRGDDGLEQQRAGRDATARPVGAGTLAGIQVCQGHCPVHHVAEQFPQLCEAEAAAFSTLLGVHVQRLATLAAGHHVCTTFIPTPTHPGSPSAAHERTTS